MATRKTYDAITDVPGIKVGHWTDRRAATGCTVVLCESGAVPGVDVRGPSPGTYETDLMRAGFAAQAVHAVFLTGGSLFGLSAATGITRWLEERGIGVLFGGQRIPIVSGAVIFDLGIGRPDVRPTAESGYAAAAAAKGGRVAQGSVGGGAGATVAKLAGQGRRFKAGIGSASEDLGDGLVVGAIVVVNAVGDVVNSEDGSVVAGPRGEDGGFQDTMASLRSGTRRPPEGNTTIGVVATNAALSKEQTNRLATVAHDGLARAIRPVHTLADGDAIFALATGAIEVESRRTIALEAFAVRAVERAIIKAVTEATSLAGVPSVSQWRAASAAATSRKRA
jgi:L-aminopeptidase/D-esterase-like protein